MKTHVFSIIFSVIFCDFPATFSIFLEKYWRENRVLAICFLGLCSNCCCENGRLDKRWWADELAQSDLCSLFSRMHSLDSRILFLVTLYYHSFMTRYHPFYHFYGYHLSSLAPSPITLCHHSLIIISLSSHPCMYGLQIVKCLDQSCMLSPILFRLAQRCSKLIPTTTSGFVDC